MRRPSAQVTRLNAESGQGELVARSRRPEASCCWMLELCCAKNLDVFTKEQVASYNGIYLSGGHGAIGDMSKSHALIQILCWALDLNKPIAAVCHGHSGLLNLRGGEGSWPFAGYRLTAFSHDEELVTNMAGRLPFVLEVELKRLGALHEKADVM